MPQTWLAAQEGTAAVAALTSPTIMPTYVMQKFIKFCLKYGIPTTHKVSAVTQLGPVPMKGAGYVAHSYKAYSLARKGVQIKLSLLLRELPLWHSTLFCNKHHNTYIAPHLIKRGVMTVAQLFDNNLVVHPHMHQFISRTWLPIYQQALQHYQALPINDWSPPAVWSSCWAKFACMAPIAPSKKIQHCATTDDWKACWPARLPPGLKDFAYHCMWHKLKVRHRLEPWLHTSACPLCGARETVLHALHNCAFYARTHKFMVECFGEWRVNGKTGRWMHFPLKQTFNTTPGLVLWTARKAHWATRCSAAPSNEPTFEQYVERWLQELKTLLVWQPLKAHHASIQKFFNSLMHFFQEGTFKTVHINWRTRRVHDVQPPLHDNPKQQRRNERKATMAQQVMAIQQVYLTEGWHIFHFDGSAKHYPKAGWVGGRSHSQAAAAHAFCWGFRAGCV